MKPAITYSLATMADSTMLVDYRMQFLEEISIPRTTQEKATVRKSLIAYFPGAVERGDCIFWLAKMGDEIVGLGGMVVYERPANFNCPSGRVGNILNMYTVPAHRKKGICKMLLEKLMVTAKELHINILELHATPEGEPVYTKYGFAEPLSPLWN